MESRGIAEGSHLLHPADNKNVVPSQEQQKDFMQRLVTWKYLPTTNLLTIASGH
jgi:hypothetical protein